MAQLGLVYPIGSVVQGVLGDTIGLRATIAGAGALFGLALLALRAFGRTSMWGLDTADRSDTTRAPTTGTETTPA